MKKELSDLKFLIAGYSLADATIAAFGYAVMLAALIGREQAAALVLSPHKELVSRIMLLFLLLFVELVYSLTLALLYDVPRKSARMQMARRHKAIVGVASVAWLLIPRLPLSLPAASGFFAVANALVALLLLVIGNREGAVPVD